MTDDYIPDQDGLVLSAPAGLPVSFTIAVGAPVNQFTSVTITGPHPATGAQQRCHYTVATGQHKAYLDFFTAFATDFGGHIPQNRRTAPAHSPDPRFRPVL